jgi:hypothetical protein
MSRSGPSKITAQLVSVWRDDSLTGAALAENVDSSGWNLIFQRARQFDEQDRAQGIDTYCLSNEAGVTSYGGISDWSIAGAELVMTLDDKVCGDLGLANEMRVALAVPPVTIEELGSVLTEILARVR